MNQAKAATPSNEVSVFIDVYLPDDEVQRFRQSSEVRAIFAEPIVEGESVVRPARLIGDVQVVLSNYLPQNVDDMRELKLLQLASSGYSQVQGLLLPARGVRVCNARGVNDTAIAEWNIAMMINLARSLPQMLRNQQSHIWDRAAAFQSEIRGATVGIWGYGGIGRQTARLCKSLGLNVHVLSRSEVGPVQNRFTVANSGDSAGVFPDRLFTIEEREEFLGSLDFLVLCLPLNAETEGIVGESEMRSLRESAFVLNPARGPLIEQSALLKALREGWIAGAAIDTHYEYPLPPEHPLWSFDNVILTPHISGSTGSTHFRVRLAALFAENLRRFLAGEPLLNELTSQQIGN